MNDITGQHSGLPSEKRNGGAIVEIRATLEKIDRISTFISELARKLGQSYGAGKDTSQEGIDRARAYLASEEFTNTEAELRRLAEPASDAVMAAELNFLIGSFPSYGKTDLTIFGAGLGLEVRRVGPSRGALTLACSELRRTQTFVPTISEVLPCLRKHERYVCHLCSEHRSIPEWIASAVADLERKKACAKPVNEVERLARQQRFKEIWEKTHCKGQEQSQRETWRAGV